MADGRLNLPNSPFETIAIADVVDRLGLENHFSFHDYDDDGRSIRHYAGDAIIEGDLDLDALFWNGVAGIWAEKDLIVNGTIFNWEIDTPACFLAIGRDLQLQEPGRKQRRHQDRPGTRGSMAC